MRRLAGALLAAVVGAAVLSGCTGSIDGPPVPPVPTGSRPEPCAQPTVRVSGVPPTPPVEAEPDLRPAEQGVPTATGVYERFKSADVERYTELLDAPVVPELTWSKRPPGVDEDVVWSELEAQASVTRRPSEALADARSLMEGLSLSPGTFLTYVGVGRRTVTFTAMCGGEVYEGRAETWTFAEGGAVDCGRPVRDAGPLTRSVHAKYC